MQLIKKSISTVLIGLLLAVIVIPAKGAEAAIRTATCQSGIASYLFSVDWGPWVNGVIIIDYVRIDDRFGSSDMDWTIRTQHKISPSSGFVTYRTYGPSVDGNGYVSFNPANPPQYYGFGTRVMFTAGVDNDGIAGCTRYIGAPW